MAKIDPKSRSPHRQKFVAAYLTTDSELKIEQFSGVKKEELFYLVLSCSFLEKNDRQDMIAVFRLGDKPTEIARSFSIILGEEKHYLTQQTQLLASELKKTPDDLAIKVLLDSYKARLEQLNALKKGSDIFKIAPTLQYL